MGLGVPRQEKWIAGRRKQIEAPVCWGVGALFDYVAGVEARVPRLMNLLALEWFWRLIMDPRGKWRRYLLGNPLFIYQVLRQKYGL
jgi:N-acetylglucosaminyldiphosphoundecaprenol N-acetyl-beta-D-mannosaminyltransferase